MTEQPTPAAEGGAPRARPASPVDQAAAVRDHVTRIVERLQAEYLPGAGIPSTSWAAGTLARLRRAQGAAGGADPRSWSLVLDGLPSAVQTPSGGPGITSGPTRAELAVHTALTTYAVHQQSRRDPQHKRGVGLGEATRSLARQRAALAPGEAVSGLDDGVVQRLHRVSMAQTQALRTDALRALVTLMRSAGSPVELDYGLLARDLFWLQFPGARHRVQLEWGRGLHRRPRGDDASASGEVADNATTLDPDTPGEQS